MFMSVPPLRRRPLGYCANAERRLSRQIAPIRRSGVVERRLRSTDPERQTEVVPRPSGFTFEQRSNGEVVIRHHGRVATTLRGRKATLFLDGATTGDAQERMARLTGNYKHGNERDRHDRARGRG